MISTDPTSVRSPLSGMLPGETLVSAGRNDPMAGHRPLEFEDFVRSTAGLFHRAALLLCGEHHGAEDLLQTTYAKLYASWPRVRATDNPVGYARKVLTHTFLSQRRLRRSGELPVADTPDSAWHDGEPSSRLDLLAALRRLPPKDRAVLVLRYWMDLDTASTAVQLGISESAVRQRASRALRRLRADNPDLTPDTTEDLR